MKKTMLFALAVALPLSAHAYKLDRMMNCDLSAQDFFAPLVQSHVIQTPAAKVAPDGNNVFKSSPDALTFHNMPVGFVYGYADDPLLFQHVAGTNIPPNYGFFVHAPIAEVQAVLRSIHSPAEVRRMEPDVTAVVCQAPA